MTAFVLRAPWYVRERAHTGVRDPAMLRPAIQMYDDPEFIRGLTSDPRDSLAFGDDDLWSYPVPVKPTGNGRLRLATWQSVTTGLRKLYQPSHNRYYAVVVEVFCDEPGLPRAGSHDDIEVGFVMRRQFAPGTGPHGRHAARTLMRQLAREQGLSIDDTVTGLRDMRDLWWADRAWRRQFLDDHADQVSQLDIDDREQGWFTEQDGSDGRWRPMEATDPTLVEQSFRMWRLPARDNDCGAARTRLTWFGLVPTYSADHFIMHGRTHPKYDSHAIYELRCFVKQPPAKGKETCPPKIWWSQAASEPFRLADPMDPEGTAKRLTSITLPDLRRLAARAGKPMGPGGVAITTPPKSGLVFNPFDTTKPGALGNGGVCTFALELFFLVAFFLFLAFLPIVVFLFQLWFLLALRFCIPPSIGLDVTATFLADASVDFSAGVAATVRAPGCPLAAELDALTPGPGPTVDEAFDQIFGTDSTLLPDKGEWLDKLRDAKDANGNPVFDKNPALLHAAVVSTDPRQAAPAQPPPRESLPPDPLCPAPAARAVI